VGENPKSKNQNPISFRCFWRHLILTLKANRDQRKITRIVLYEIKRNKQQHIAPRDTWCDTPIIRRRMHGNLLRVRSEAPKPQKQNEGIGSLLISDL
jgi:hypothetical protein